jgi:hypothetical protein
LPCLGGCFSPQDSNVVIVVFHWLSTGFGIFCACQLNVNVKIDSLRMENRTNIALGNHSYWKKLLPKTSIGKREVISWKENWKISIFASCVSFEKKVFHESFRICIARDSGKVVSPKNLTFFRRNFRRKKGRIFLKLWKLSVHRTPFCCKSKKKKLKTEMTFIFGSCRWDSQVLESYQKLDLFY